MVLTIPSNLESDAAAPSLFAGVSGLVLSYDGFLSVLQEPRAEVAGQL